MADKFEPSSTRLVYIVATGTSRAPGRCVYMGQITILESAQQLLEAIGSDMIANSL